MRKLTRILTAILFVALAGPVVAQELTKVRFIHEWRFEGHVAPFLVALDKGFYEEEGLDVTIDPGTGSLDGINRIASGSYDIGQMDLNALIKYRDSADAAKIKAVLVTYNKPPFAVLTLKKNGIAAPKDLEGKTIGAPAADAAYSHWPIFAKINDVDSSTINFENVGFPVRETLLVQGQVDAVTAFISNILALKAMGISDDEAVGLMMADYGVDLYGSAVMASPKFLEENPEAVKGFVRATIRGFQEAYRDPEGAMDSLMKFNPIAKRDIELERLQVVASQCYFTDHVKENGFGTVEMERLASSIDQLATTFDFTNKPAADDVYTDAFLPPREERMLP
ncbi:ABC transporter substrate-binding protein [Nitratireductor mangrovi]|uniref:ABC transporter substrate-binding protein n=1 Tax=Nitratireductor mangrovi TaxID=2599600 RepID=A0A5B8KWB6_9HYPH|nr:ABC transporter substrate-binding protein [Nitratireductor mangrovi]QDY99851.1 ABC transporter substrate-binding protein [Nitratireductor mangrovi]